jgi:hypothetical protein
MGRPKTSWTGDRNPRWNGGVRTHQGYTCVRRPDHPNASKDGYVREHVLILSEHLGRPIASNEIVHHKNGVRSDNRLENLELMTRSEHHSLHHKGVHKPGSIAALRGHTSEEMRVIWATTLAHKRSKPKFCAGCGVEFFRRGSRPKYCSRPCYFQSRIKDR